MSPHLSTSGILLRATTDGMFADIWIWREKYPWRLYKSQDIWRAHQAMGRRDGRQYQRTTPSHTCLLVPSIEGKRLLKLSAQLQTSTSLRSSPTMTSVAGAKGNVGSRAMEATLTPTSTEMSPDEWQSFLIKTMNDVSGPLARNMLDKIGLNASTATPFRLLDHGCGLGVVAPVLMETVPKAVLERSSVLCGDYSEALVQTVRARIEREGWVGCEAKVVDAQVCASLLSFPKSLLIHEVYTPRITD